MPGIVRPTLPVRQPPPFQEPTAPVQTGTRPTLFGPRPVTAQKPVSSFTHGGMAGAVPQQAPAGKPPKVIVKIHPNGHIEIQHSSAQPVAPVASTAPAAPAAPKHPAVKPSRVPTVATATAPAPQTVAQQAQSLIDYATKAVSDPINQRIADQQAAITGSTKELADLMAKYGPASKAIYAGAQQGQAAVDSALGATLGGQGQSGQDALSAKLAAIDADPATAARLNATAGANTAGAVGAMAGRGSSALSNLISQGASAQDMGAKLPGVAGEFGLQATRTAQRQGTTDLADAVSAIQAKYPDVVNQLNTTRQQQSANETTRALAATQALGHAPAWAAKILGVAPGTPSASVLTANTRAATSKAAAATKATNAAGKVNLPLSKEYKVLVNANGDPVLKNGQIVRLPGSTTDGLSVKDFKKYSSQAKAGAILAHNGGTDAKGNPLPPISWLQYRQHGLAAGIPEEILIGSGKQVYSPREIKLGLIPKVKKSGG